MGSFERVRDAVQQGKTSAIPRSQYALIKEDEREEIRSRGKGRQGGVGSLKREQPSNATGVSSVSSDCKSGSMTSEASCGASSSVEEYEYERKEWSLVCLQKIAEFKMLMATPEGEQFCADCQVLSESIRSVPDFRVARINSIPYICQSEAVRKYPQFNELFHDSVWWAIELDDLSNFYATIPFDLMKEDRDDVVLAL